MIQATVTCPPVEAVTSITHRPVNNRPFAPVLIIVEGVHDVEFLRKLTSKLHRQDVSIPDLAELEHDQLVIFIPFGGGHVLPWASRFAPLRCSEFHLYDREDEPETAIRRQAVDLIHARPGCRALLLTKRSLESYLHPAAIFDAGGGQFSEGYGEDVTTSVARSWFVNRPHDCDWQDLPPHARRRMATQAKRWLNSEAVPHMTLGLLMQTDPTSELLTWLRDIGTAVDDF